MVEISNLFSESENSFVSRLSTVLIFTFVYYHIGYYIILYSDKKCITLPNIEILLIFLVFHILQTAAIVSYFNSSEPRYYWAIAVGPLLLFYFYNQYISSSNIKKEAEIKQMLQQLQKKNNQTQIYDEDTTVTGMHNKMMKSNSNNPSLTDNEMNNLFSINSVPDYGGPVVGDKKYMGSKLDPYGSSFSPF